MSLANSEEAQCESQAAKKRALRRVHETIARITSLTTDHVSSYKLMDESLDRTQNILTLRESGVIALLVQSLHFTDAPHA